MSTTDTTAAEAIARGKRILDVADIAASMLSEDTRLALTVLCVCHPELVDAVVELINKARIAEARSCTCLGGELP